MNMVTANIVNAVGQIHAESYDPAVTANGNAPWMGTLRDIAGFVMATCIVILVMLLIVGAVLLVMGKLSHHGGAQGVGVTVLIWALVGAAIIGSASGLVFWFTSLSLANGGGAAG